MALRRLPRVGQAVTIVYLDEQVAGMIERVSRDHHDVDVLAQDGELVTFRLNPATARFMGAGRHAGARLLFEGS